jgi:hypothetical protein
MKEFEELDRRALRLHPLGQRRNKVNIVRDHVAGGEPSGELSESTAVAINELSEKMVRARETSRPRILAMGAHVIKNGLGPVLIQLMEDGWFTHVATNGAGIIHDWEFAFQGESSEDVRENIARGQFGLWEETGFYINLAIVAGAFDGLGYGESVGKFIEDDGMELPSESDMKEIAADLSDDNLPRAAAAIDLLRQMRTFDLKPGWLEVPHLYKEFSIQAAARRLGIPLTGHPMIGHDIIYCHPMNDCAAVGRAAERDFLRYAHQISQLEGGVYLSIGSAVMSPMVFEKSLSMARNLALQAGDSINNHYMAVVDLQESRWDWSKGEPPEDTPDYYLRFCKTFARMGGTLRYIQADNRDLLLGMAGALAGST